MKLGIAVMLPIVLVPLQRSAGRADETHIFQLCNHLDYKIFAAISERDGIPGGRVVKGWYEAAPGACARIAIHNDYFYIHVRGRVGDQIRVTIPQPVDGDNFNISYCFDPDYRFEYHGSETVCGSANEEVFYDWHFYERGERWDIR